MIFMLALISPPGMMARVWINSREFSVLLFIVPTSRLFITESLFSLLPMFSSDMINSPWGLEEALGL